MLQETGALVENFVTVWTGLVLGHVTSAMRRQMSLAGEVFRTEIATERPFRGLVLLVGTLMEQQITLELKRLSTFVTTKRPLTCVTSHVIDQRLLFQERFRAHRTIELSFHGVLFDMIVQLLLPSKRFRAELTLVR